MLQMRRLFRSAALKYFTAIAWGARIVLFTLLVYLGAHFWYELQAAERRLDQRIEPYFFPHSGIGDIILTGVIQGCAALCVIGFVRWITSEARFAGLRKRLLPINLDITPSHRKAIYDYMNAIASRVRQLLPEDLRSIAAERPMASPLIIPLEGEVNPSFLNSNLEYGRIDNVLTVLDRDYLLNPENDVQPLILQGDPGCGKSTLIFEIFRILRVRLDRLRGGWIPLLVFVHDLDPTILQSCRTMQDLLVGYFNERSRHLRHSGLNSIANLLRTSYDQYRFVVIFDGLDEFGDRSKYTTMAASLNRLIDPRTQLERDTKPFPGANRYIVSCRTEDNQHLISGNVITLRHLTFEYVIKYLRTCLRLYKRQGRTIDADQVRAAITGLETSAANRLLQNYVSNPYLLSLIAKYYTHRQRPLAETLDDVFKDVLARELMKSHGPHTQLMNYVPRLLAPYAYARVAASLESSDAVNFLDTLRSEPRISDILFGTPTQSGYLRAVFANDQSTQFGRYGELVQEWGSEEANRFQASLTQMVQHCHDLSEFEATAAGSIRDRLFEIIKDSTIAILTDDGREIERFRHRRLQDYFVAQYIDRVGLNNCPGICERLSNAWLREPLRIYAATGSSSQDLLEECCRRFDSIGQTADLDQFERLSLASNLAVNASSAIEYLPGARGEPAPPVLLGAVLAVGERVHGLHHLLMSDSASALWERSEAYLLRIKCLECLKSVYASEFLCSNLPQDAAETIFGSVYHTRSGEQFNSWRSIYRASLKQGEPYQHVTYKALYPIKSSNHRFPISRLSLFIYVVEVVLPFAQKYHDLILGTHSTMRSRILIATAAKAARIWALLLLAMAIVMWWRTFGFGLVGIVVAGVAAVTCTFLIKRAQERGMVGDRSELPGLPYWIVLLWMKRALTSRVEFDKPIARELPQLLHVGSATLTGPSVISPVHKVTETESRPVNMQPEPRFKLPSFRRLHVRVKARTATTALTLLVALMVLVVISSAPLLLQASQVFVQSASILEVSVDAYFAGRNTERLTTQADSLLARDAPPDELLKVRALLAAGRDNLNRLLLKSDTLGSDGGSGLQSRVISRVVGSLSSANKQVVERERRVQELLTEDTNTSDWEVAQQSIRTLDTSMMDFQAPSRNASSVEIDEALKRDEQDRSKMKALRSTALMFRGRRLKGGRIADVDTALASLTAMEDTLDKRLPALLTELEAARTREATADFLNAAPALVAEVRRSVQHSIPKDISSLRESAAGAHDLAERVNKEIQLGNRLLAQHLSESATSEVSRSFVDLQAAANRESEVLAVLDSRIESMEFRESMRALIDSINSLMADLRRTNSTEFANPDTALSDLGSLRERFQSTMQEAQGLKARAGPEELAAIESQNQRLTDGLGEVQDGITRWTSRLEFAKRQAGIQALNDRIKVAIRTVTSENEASELLAEIDGIESESANLGQPQQLKAGLDKLETVRSRTAALLRRYQKKRVAASNPAPPIAAVPTSEPVLENVVPQKPNPNALLEARCASLAANSLMDSDRVQQLNSFLSQDAPVLREATKLVREEPHVKDQLLGKYRDAERRLAEFRQLQPSLVSLRQSVAEFEVEVAELLKHSDLSQACRSTLMERSSNVEEVKARLGDVDGLDGELRSVDFDQALLRTEAAAGRDVRRLAGNSLAVLFAAFMIGLILKIYNQYSNREGLKELRKLRRFDELIEFAVTNSYSLPLNYKVVAKIQAVMPHSSEALRKLSDAAEAREKRGIGVVNEDVAGRLRELARGLDNILNR